MLFAGKSRCQQNQMVEKPTNDEVLAGYVERIDLLT